MCARVCVRVCVGQSLFFVCDKVFFAWGKVRGKARGKVYFFVFVGQIVFVCLWGEVFLFECGVKVKICVCVWDKVILCVGRSVFCVGHGVGQGAGQVAGKGAGQGVFFCVCRTKLFCLFVR